MAGLILVFQKHKDIIRYSFLLFYDDRQFHSNTHGRSQTEWNLVFALIRSTMAHPEAARLSFDLIEALVADGPDNSVSLDNFSGLLTVLDDFATSANMLQEQQLQRGRRNEPFSSSKYLPSLIPPFSFLTTPFLTSSPGIKRGKTAVDLLPVLHKRLSSWVRTSEIQEGQGNL
jgi:golgi-specific brefeldin A-resistance guanine nucleotide exchange factor 1